MTADAAADRALVAQLADEVFGAGVWGDGDAAGSVSSVETMRFLVRLEKRLQVSIPDAELLPEHFQSIDTVLAMIARCRALPEEAR